MRVQTDGLGIVCDRGPRFLCEAMSRPALNEKEWVSWVEVDRFVQVTYRLLEVPDGLPGGCACPGLRRRPRAA